MKLLSTLALALAVATTPAWAQGNYPTKPIKIIVAYPAGQGTDIATRYLSEQVSKELGQPIVIDNRAGAGGEHRNGCHRSISERWLHPDHGHQRDPRAECLPVRQHRV